ncbi:MAG: M23 family metallopeptidase, partial [Clostridiaceae bacterium]|nr:M23 family metallopeptidase [Clostridiaceae bacterium]
GWTKSGDTRTITQLGPLVPTSGNNMAIISTGLGSTNNSNSWIEQKFYIPEGSNTLSFDYNLVSEEPMEFVGSRYDDKFQCTIVLSKGTTVIAEESINTSVWLPVKGIDFYGGDSTSFMTGWKHLNFDVSQHQGQYATLKFHVWDVGDSAYDTAVLVDNINIDGLLSNPGADSSGDLLTWPVASSNITLYYGEIDEQYNKKHAGIDIQCEQGDPVFSAYSGEIIYAGYEDGYGNLIVINSKFDDNYMQIRYAHLDSINVEIGDNVFVGEEVGTVGNTGDVVGGYVLHFEVLKSTNNSPCLIDGSNCETVDPLNYLIPLNNLNFDYLTKPFAVGTTKFDEFGTMSSSELTPDQRYILNLDLENGENSNEVYLRKIYNSFSSRWNPFNSIKWIPAENAALVKLNGKEKYFGVGNKYNNARIVNDRLVVEIDDFIQFFYPELQDSNKFNKELSISLKDTFNYNVLKLQKKLKELGYLDGNGNELNCGGFFNENTQYAVYTFKLGHGLLNKNDIHGKVDSKTWNVLFSDNAKPYKELKSLDKKYYSISYFEELNKKLAKLKKWGTPKSDYEELFNKMKSDVLNYGSDLRQLRFYNEILFKKVFETIDYLVTKIEMTKEVHYFRNELNKFSGAPDTLDEMVKLAQKGKWILYPRVGSIYHMYGEDGEFNLKFACQDKRFEAVYKKNKQLATEESDPINMGTYNYSVNDHDKYDVKTWENWGNIENEPEKEDINWSFVFTGKYNNEEAKKHYEEYEKLIKAKE